MNCLICGPNFVGLCGHRMVENNKPASRDLLMNEKHIARIGDTAIFYFSNDKSKCGKIIQKPSQFNEFWVIEELCENKLITIYIKEFEYMYLRKQK